MNSFSFQVMKIHRKFVCVALAAVVLFQFLGIFPQPVCAAEVVAWGDNSSSPTHVPSGLRNGVAVAAGNLHSLALRADGTVAAWGDKGFGQTTVPSGLSNVVAIAAGGYHSLALRADGTMAAWGDNADGETNVPSGCSSVVAIAAGDFHSLA